MDQTQRERIRDDLKGIIKGELLFDDLARILYSTDASVFQVEPIGVAVPHDEEDVQALVRYAGDRQIALVPRGAGTGLAGEALGTGLIVDLSRHFRAILEIGGDTVRVQPGVIYRHLNDQLARHGRRFAPDPTGGVPCTIGGMLATNASGARVMRYGYTRDHAVSLRAVLDSAEAAPMRRFPLTATPEGRLGEIVAGVTGLLQRHADVIRRCQPRTPFNRCGYLLEDVLTNEYLDLARLLVGSEGTLAFFTEATLRTLPLPAGRSLVLLGFDSLDAALQGAQRTLSSGPTACELMDRRLLSLARGGVGGAASLIPAALEAVLLVEYETESQASAQVAAAELVRSLHHLEQLAVHSELALEPEHIERIWSFREAALPSLYGLRGGAQPIAFVEDVGVPPEELPHFIHHAQEVLQRYETTASYLIHAGTGQVHIRPFLDLQRPEDASRLWPLAEAIYNLVLEVGGTISTQHGTGLARTPWVPRQYGELYPVFGELKTLFDPRRLFNPGKIVGPDPGVPTWPLRPMVPRRESIRAWQEEAISATDTDSAAVTSPQSSSLTPQLRWQFPDIWAESASCNGCGHCRTETPSLRMCPLMRATHSEEASPRAKANLMRHLLQEGTDPQLLSSDAVREVADLCVNCKMCALECPARVNIPKLMLEAKAANVTQHGLSRSDWVLARTETFARLGSAFALLANAALRSRTVRWLLEKFFGLSRHRRLPSFAAHSFLRQAERAGWTRRPRSTRPRVVYFVDVYANYNDPSIARASVAVLHHNGIEVYVPPGQRGCGMAPLAYGEVESAREAAEHNLRLLADLAREGYPILCSEPTAALMLRQDALDLLDDPDARLISDHTVELTTYLWNLHLRGRLQTDFQRLDFSVGHHVPCHLKALGRPPMGPALLGLIPGLHAHTIDVHCSGMAGTFGLKAENYHLSLEAGRPMLEELARPRVLFGSTECSTCRLQMEDGVRKRTLHPVQYLALAYGLMPELRRRLKEPIRGDLVLQ